MAGEDDLRNEIASLQHRANEIADKSLESTDRMVNYVVEARDAGVRSAEMLVGQREQLEHIDGGLNAISADMDRIDVDITELEKCCGVCVCPWNTAKGVQAQARVKERVHVVMSQPTHSAPTEQPLSREEGRFFEQITGDAREDQMEENLTQITNVLAELKPIAEDMGNEIALHNEILGDINENAEANKEKIQSAHQRLVRVDRRT